MILDTARVVLPEGLTFLGAGWWVLHALAVGFVFAWAYRKGRSDERRHQRHKDIERGR
ncbi:MAG: hypothetical protein HOP12_14970 [Candidatus Eisenbacteria bacterium]|uniref:Uncharacterized protein n=1 Tax=Eiseniibacteriota bacterium TaxID=2212470 RepID=A0A849STM6_UNCEI|nr:hypothetical protein [Candidatus Eisenbacteria bacterium]